MRYAFISMTIIVKVKSPSQQDSIKQSLPVDQDRFITLAFAGTLYHGAMGQSTKGKQLRLTQIYQLQKDERLSWPGQMWENNLFKVNTRQSSLVTPSGFEHGSADPEWSTWQKCVTEKQSLDLSFK